MRQIHSKYNLEGKAPFLKRSTTISVFIYSKICICGLHDESLLKIIPNIRYDRKKKKLSQTEADLVSIRVLQTN